jgi:hypothetical protein
MPLQMRMKEVNTHVSSLSWKIMGAGTRIIAILDEKRGCWWGDTFATTDNENAD